MASISGIRLIVEMFDMLVRALKEKRK